MAKKKKEAPCASCGIETLVIYGPERSEFYMVHPAMWDTYGADRGFMCIGCLEARLGRELNADDFTECTLNDLTVSDTSRYAWSYRSDRLKSRLSRTRCSCADPNPYHP